LKIEIRSQHFDLDEDITVRIINRVRFALSRLDSEISHVQIRFTDTKGPKGGRGNHCLLLVKLISSGKIVAKGKGVDLLSALHFCVERTKRTIIRELDRKRFVPIRMNRRRQKRKNLAPDEKSEYPVGN
jgi:hypothetical protein